ncbi:hypothetical protein F2Q69_00036800 [Brassica cretica]|uniref:Uncharacterized protein n=1 Tax=Brassica cretica TaxID=69181 RepID=A0A8S9SH28_BRACR|nr:hypothetical protein F2Q69_00036800 [Brassica cretica]
MIKLDELSTSWTTISLSWVSWESAQLSWKECSDLEQLIRVRDGAGLVGWTCWLWAGDGVGLAKVATFQPSRTDPSSKLYPFAQGNGQPHSL